MSRRRTIIIVASSESAPNPTTQLADAALTLGANVLLSEGVKVTVEYSVPDSLSNSQAAAVVLRVLDKLDSTV